MSDEERYHHGALRSALLGRAVVVIAESGVEAVSLRALARDLGVSHAAPLRHYPTRAALLAAIAEQGVAMLLEAALRRAEAPDRTPLERLRLMTEGYVSWARENPAHHLLIRNQDVMRHADPGVRARINAYARLHEAKIREAQEAGWRRDEPTERLFLQITALTAGLALTASDPIYETVFGARPSADAVSEALGDFFGVKGPLSAR